MNFQRATVTHAVKTITTAVCAGVPEASIVSGDKFCHFRAGGGFGF